MEKHHEQIFKMVETHYYFLADRVPVRQDSLFKTYLWLASLVLALNLSLLPKLATASCWAISSYSSVLLAFCVILLALNAMRGKAADNLKTPDFGTYLSYLDNPDYDTPYLVRMIADDLTIGLNHQREIQSSRGLRLRTMSWILLLAFAFLALASGGVLT